VLAPEHTFRGHEKIVIFVRFVLVIVAFVFLLNRIRTLSNSFGKILLGSRRAILILGGLIIFTHPIVLVFRFLFGLKVSNEAVVR
jgi:hypothetical protein